MSLADVSAFLLSLRQEESLGRGTVLWTEVSCKQRFESSIKAPSSHGAVTNHYEMQQLLSKLYSSVPPHTSMNGGPMRFYQALI